MTYNPHSTSALTDLFAKYHYEKKLAEAQLKGESIDDIVLGIKPTVAYYRVSTQKQSDVKNSIPQQKEIVQDYCLKNKLKIITEYKDDPGSGGDFNRPDLQNMLNALKPGITVIVATLSRLTRNLNHCMKILEIIKSKQCDSIILDCNIDTSTIFGQMSVSIMAMCAEMERDNIKSRITNVMNDMSSKGTLRTKPKYGWKRIKDPENDESTILVEVPQEQITINIIKTLIDNNPTISVATICRQLKLNNCVNRKGKPINNSTVDAIIEHNNLRHSDKSRDFLKK